MPKKLKDWLIRRLGGYRTVYAEKTVVRNFSGEKVLVTVDIPNEFLVHIIDVETEVRQELANRFAKHIFENMPQENITVERIYASDSVLCSARLWIEYDCNLRRRLDEHRI